MPFFIPLIGYGAAATGLGAGATAIAGAIPGVKETLELDEKGRGKAEVNQGKDKGYDYRTGQINRGLGEKILDGLLGNDPTKIQENAKTGYVEGLTEKFGDRIERTKGVKGYEPIGNLSRMSADALDQELTRRQETKSARSRAAIETGIDRSNFEHLTDPGEIIATGARMVKDEADKKTKEAEDKDNKRYSDSQALLLMNMENTQANLRADRELRRDQQAYQNRVLDLKEARMDRRDRQAAIQQMMAGLAQLGASIAI